jgi:hypothetical protein
MKTQFKIRIGLIKPVRRMVVGRTIKATDRAWREAMFGLGGSRRRLGGVRLGVVDGQPLALIVELQTERITDGGSPWVITGGERSYAMIGPAAVYNDAGFGPADLGISLDRLKEMVRFDPDPTLLEAALRNTKELEDSDDVGRRIV